MICDGETLLDSYYSVFGNVTPLMLPPAFRQRFVDKYSEEDLKVKKKKVFDSKRIDMNAEGTIYFALERSDQRVTVLHGFTYNAAQWTFYVNGAVQGQDGEHDFLMIFPNGSVVCIEVKNPLSEKSYNRSVIDASKQLKKISLFLDGVARFLGVKINIEKCCAFPLIKKDHYPFKSQIGGHMHFLWEEDLQDINGKISSVFKETSNPSCSSVHALLVGLWINNHDQIDKKTYWNVFGNMINEIDDSLLNQTIYCKADKRSEDLVSIPRPYKNIFKTCLQNIQYITKDQEQILSASPHVFVNGPAGAGKTLIMYARILKCIEEDEQVFVLLPWDHHALELTNLVQIFKPKVTARTVDLVTAVSGQGGCPILFKEMMENCKETLIIFIRPNFLLYRRIYQSIPPDNLKLIQNSFLETLATKKSPHIFCDDFQNSMSHSIFHRISFQTNLDGWTHPISSNDVVLLADFLFQLFSKPTESKRVLWIGCDLLQITQYRLWGTSILIAEVCRYLAALDREGSLHNQTFLLSANMRNSFNIGMILKEGRDKILGTIGPNFDGKSLLKLLPPQQISHYIYGPSPHLYCILESQPYSDTTSEIIQNEVKSMFWSLQATTESHRKIAVIPLYLHSQYLADVESPNNGEKIFWEFREKILALAFPEDVNSDYVRANNVKYFNSLEFSCAVLVLDVSCNVVADALNNEKYDEQAWMNILAHLFAAISRARVACSIVLISTDSKPGKLFHEIRSLLYPYVKTISIDTRHGEKVMKEQTLQQVGN